MQSGITETCDICSFCRFEIEGCEVVWAIKDNFVNSTFVDEGASVFLLPQLHQKTPVSKIPKKRTKYVVNG